jgi:hypothetical protein
LFPDQAREDAGVEGIGCGRVNLHESGELCLAFSDGLGVEEVDDEVAIFDANHVGGEGAGATRTGMMVEVARASRLE